MQDGFGNFTKGIISTVSFIALLLRKQLKERFCVK